MSIKIWFKLNMTDKFSKETRSYNMSQIKSKDTKPEILVRKYLFSNGFRYKLHDNKLPGKPDIVLPKYRSVIFVNGCFWHGHKCKVGKRKPKSNTEYWYKKIDNNILRDKKNIRLLKKEGWRILTIWECEIKYQLKLQSKVSKFINKK